MFEILLKDALEGLSELEDGSVDLVITDPPYESLEKWRNMGTTTRLKKSKQSSNNWFPTVPNSYFEDFFPEIYRVLKKGTHMYVMCDEETSDILKPIIRAAGFQLRKSLIWHKVGKKKEIKCPKCKTVVCEQHSPGTPGMGYPYRSCYEMILLAQKGKRKPPENKGVRNVLNVPWIKSKTAYPTEKPTELLEILIKQSSFEGDLILDPFAGSGSTGAAAFNTDRNFLGFDVAQDSIDYFHNRRKGWIWGADTDFEPEEEFEDVDETSKVATIMGLFGKRR
jgi:site-specific DNA-methyltransferase (adenine-specific)